MGTKITFKCDPKDATAACCLEKCAGEWMAAGFKSQASWENWASNALISLS